MGERLAAIWSREVGCTCEQAANPTIKAIDKTQLVSFI
jgi:hypothetical protein